MSTNFSVAVSSDALAAWAKDQCGPDKPYPNVNRLINEALKNLRADLDGRDAGEITTETVPQNVTETQIKEMKAEMGAQMVIDCIPPIPPGENAKTVHASIRDEDHRLIQQALQLPGLQGRVPADLVRAFIFIGLKALEEIRKIDAPQWKSQMALAKGPVERERRKRNEERLAALIENFRDDLLELAQQDRWDEAWVRWRDFYELSLGMEWYLREAALYSLLNMPISQRVMVEQSHMLPADIPAPVLPPSEFHYHSDIGVYKPGMAITAGHDGQVKIHKPIQYGLLEGPS